MRKIQGAVEGGKGQGIDSAMNGNNRYSGYALILRSVRTPLGFFTLIALLLDGIILTAAITTESVPLYWPLLVLGVVIVLVFVLVWQKPDALRDPSDLQRITVTLVFTDDEIPGDFDVENCHFVIRDIEGRKKHEGTPNLVPGPTNWFFTLSVPALSSDSMRIHLVDTLGRKWKAGPFLPYQTSTKVAREGEPRTS